MNSTKKYSGTHMASCEIQCSHLLKKNSMFPALLALKQCFSTNKSKEITRTKMNQKDKDKGLCGKSQKNAGEKPR